jgi:hypothetical protein
MKLTTLKALPLLLVALAVFGCTPLPAAAPSTTPAGVTATQAVSTPLPTEPTASPTPAQATAIPPSDTPNPSPTTPGDVSGCPRPSGDAVLYVNRDDGYCLLYPSIYTAQVSADFNGKALVIRGQSPTPSPKFQEAVTVSLSIALNSLPEGMDSRAYATRWSELFAPGMNLVPQDATFGTQPAAVLSNQPGMVTQRSGFVVTQYARYALNLVPDPQDDSDQSRQAAALWDRVTTSIVFFQPQALPTFRKPEEACPKPNAEQKLFTSLTDGYCLLYPADFEADKDFAGRITGGPVLGNVSGFGDVRTSLTMGTFGYVQDQTPRQVLQPRLDQIDAASVQDATLGGSPAVIFRDPRGPWASKQAMIVAGGYVYTIVAQPFEPERYPAGIPYLNRLWDSVAGSLAFFTPWR